jgi:hypothetical protein
MKIPATVRRIAITGALALTLFALSVPAASAGENEEIVVKGGWAAFKHKDEILLARDNLGDHLGVRAHLLWDGRAAHVTDASGGSTAGRNLSIPEGTTVWLVVCYTRHGEDVQCSGAQKAEA